MFLGLKPKIEVGKESNSYKTTPIPSRNKNSGISGPKICIGDLIEIFDFFKKKEKFFLITVHF